MKTVILNIPDGSEKWFRTLFDKFNLRHKILSNRTKEDLIFAKLIDEAMKEEGEVDSTKVIAFVKKHGS